MKYNSTRLRKGIYILIIILLLVVIGFWRDFVFKTINALLRAWDLDQEFQLPAFLSFLNDLEYDTIVNIKWLLTLAVSIIYLTIALITIRILFIHKKYLKITAFTYAGLIVISAIFISVGFVRPSMSEKMYEFARYLMGMAQSPIILMLLIPAFKLSDKENDKISDS